MQSLPEGYRALVIGARGALGSAFVHQLQADPRCGSLAALHRASVPAIDFAQDGSIANAAAALHPGTVRSDLSRPFRGDQIGREPAQAAAEMLAVLDGLQAEDSGAFVAYSGERLPW